MFFIFSAIVYFYFSDALNLSSMTTFAVHLHLYYELMALYHCPCKLWAVDVFIQSYTNSCLC